MIDQTDFSKKQFVFYFPCKGDKMSFQNDNLVIKDKDRKIKFQVTCYRIFIVFVVGDTTITTGLLNRADKFGFSLCLMNRNMKVYKFISARMEGNTLLRKRQYTYESMELGQYIILNKLLNQRKALMGFRKKTGLTVDAIRFLDEHIKKLQSESLDMNTILGIEGSAARVYFPQMFDNVKWAGRKPRIKNDYINAALDIGYTILFNVIDALLNVYGFDEYYGVLHRCFYMRKSLVCDLMEPLRPVIDYTLRKSINLKQIKEEDFKVFDKRYVLEWKKSPEYSQIFLKAILEYRNELFLYIQGYYRAFMKQKPVTEFPVINYKG
ncbi:MAG: type V CRISPR-associated endonuclease Cas1 [Eubacterium sp.]|jgi:CRISPR-associated endonuclease Cas1|nr:type V CRISPR-associated endonuclease Cas1 [Eubacterium sp.]